MTENKTEKSRWSVPLRVLAVVLVAALFCSLVLPTLTGIRTAKGSKTEEEQTKSSAESYEALADLAISEERYQEAADWLERVGCGSPFPALSENGLGLCDVRKQGQGSGAS